MALEFTYLTICRSFVPCHLSLFRYLSNFGEIDRFNVPSHRSLYIMHYWPISVSQDAGYWPSSFFRVFMDTRCQCLDGTSWSIKEFIIKNGQKENFFLRDFYLYAGNPERVRLAHLARRGSQSEHRNRFILPTRGFSHILKSPIVTSLSLGTVDAHPSFLLRVPVTFEKSSCSKTWLEEWWRGPLYPIEDLLTDSIWS